jgi:glutaredoxin
MKVNDIMKQLLYFKLAQCPYCKQADRWLKELMEENPRYQEISIRTVLEDEEKEFADSYDYYKVPCFFYGDEKLHEGVASRDIIKKVLDYCLE